MKKLLDIYLEKYNKQDLSSSAISFYSAIDSINSFAPSIAKSIVKELIDQRNNLKLIASENYSSLTVQLAQGNLLTDKYAEGYAGHRFYAGCDNVDNIELEAAKLACDLFGAEHAYVQPHSGADANLVAFLSILTAKIQDPFLEKLIEKNPTKISKEDWNKLRNIFLNQKLMALDYYSGGHLSHGYRFNFSSILFDAYLYTVDEETGLLNYDKIREQLKEIRPLIFLAGYSSYPRKINFAKLKELADEVGAVFMVDMAHFAGLVAGKVFKDEFSPFPFADVVTTTTHKTLRGPRGGIVFCKKEYADYVNRGCPTILGGPLPHVMAAKAVALHEALKPEFAVYANKIVENAKYLAEACLKEDLIVQTNGTDNHLILIDVYKSFELTGRQAESALRECGITLNRNVLPFDKNGPWYTSGLRIGTPAITTLGMGKDEIQEIAKIIKLVLSNTNPTIIEKGNEKGQKSQAKYTIPIKIKEEALKRVQNILMIYPVYPEIDLSLISTIFTF